jgi:hypothetical protein
MRWIIVYFSFDGKVLGNNYYLLAVPQQNVAINSSRQFWGASSTARPSLNRAVDDAPADSPASTESPDNLAENPLSPRNKMSRCPLPQD